MPLDLDIGVYLKDGRYSNRLNSRFEMAFNEDIFAHDRNSKMRKWYYIATNSSMLQVQ